METIQGLNALIKKRLIEKKGNVKLTENTDIILYGRALGINENQLLFKILEIEESIDWEKEKDLNINTNTNEVPNINNVIYCSNCKAANEKGVANFCNNCGKEIKNISVTNEKGVPNQNSTINKFNPTILFGILFLMIFFGGIFYFLKHGNSPDTEVGVTEVGVTEVTNVNEIEFIERINPSNSNKEYITNFPKLKKYVFSYGGKKWSYSNTEGRNIMGDFYKKTLDDFNLTSDEKQSLIEKLEKISGHEILEKAEEKKALEKKALEKKALEKKPEKKAAREKQYKKNKDLINKNNKY